MKFNENVQLASLGRGIGGALLSIVVGWLFLLVIVVSYDWIRAPNFHWWANELIVVPGSLPFVVAPGLFVFLPLYVFVQPNSVLWSWPVCASCGALFGASLMFVLGFPNPLAQSNIVFIVFAALTGGVTCLFASLTKSKFHCSARSKL